MNKNILNPILSTQQNHYNNTTKSFMVSNEEGEANDAVMNKPFETHFVQKA